MFGYIKPYVPELKVREYELYKAIYCGLCKSMGRGTTALSRLTLSYDMAYLAAVRCLLTNTPICVKQGRCGANAFKKCMMAGENPQLRYVSAISAYLTHYKVLDDIRDKRGAAGFFMRFALPFTSMLKHKASKLTDYPIEKITKPLDELFKLEQNKSPSVDEAAEIFGVMVAEISSYGLEGKAAEAAYKIGLNTGRFIYLADAADDLDKDIKAKNYNPLAYSAVSRKESLLAVQGAMNIAADTVYGEIVLFDAAESDLKSLSENVAQLGMMKVSDEVTKEKKNRKKNRR